MKIQVLGSILLGYIVYASALRCWTCENSNSPKHCVKTGYSKQCEKVEKVCQTEARFSVGWSKTPIIRTGCKEPLACGNNDIQNPRQDAHNTQCNRFKYNSVCRCCCTGDHCNMRNLLCDNSTMDIDMPDLSHFKFNNETNSNPSPTPPAELMCHALSRAPTHGRMECNGAGEVGTICTFTCNDGFVLVGGSSSVCEKMEKAPTWSDVPPQCVVPQRQCAQLGHLRHGRVTCSRGDNFIGTSCKFECTEEGYNLLPFGIHETECQQVGVKAMWSRRMPCCNAHCPPIAKKDIVIVIDSSRSISLSEWHVMKNFVANVIRSFHVANDTAQFAVYRFSGIVDTESQVLFGDYETADQLADSVRKLPKNRGGTLIGKALRYAQDYVLKHNNRPDVEDMIWVLTDGKSKDEFHEIATELRRNGVEIIALWVAREGEESFKEKLMGMTGDEDLVMKVDDIIDSFTNVLVEKVAGKICEMTCE